FFSVLGEFPTEPVTSEAHTPTPTGEGEEDVSRPSSNSEPRRSGKFLKWLVEEIGVVEEMIRRRVLSV
ncbi:hypothetical protein Taro_034379, partial [Colocasia esculenta]|nr:hypothetical protein [Colocasia esculenta]